VTATDIWNLVAIATGKRHGSRDRSGSEKRPQYRGPTQYLSSPDQQVLQGSLQPSPILPASIAEGCVALGVGSAKEGSSAKFPRAQGYPTASGSALLAVTSGAFLADRALCATLNLAHAPVMLKALDDTWLDTTSPHGELIFTIMGAMACEEGIRRAKARGKQFGRPAAVQPP